MNHRGDPSAAAAGRHFKPLRLTIMLMAVTAHDRRRSRVRTTAIKLILTLSIVLAASPLAAPPPAHARTFSVRPLCLGPGYIPSTFVSTESSVGTHVTFGCNLTTFAHAISRPEGIAGGFQYPSWFRPKAREGVKLEGLTATLRGSNGESAGTVVGVRLAWGTLPHQMGPLATKTSDSPLARITPEAVTLSAEELPSVPDRILITAECINPPSGDECLRSDDLLIDDLVVRFRDDHAPSLSIKAPFKSYGSISKTTSIEVIADDAERVDSSTASVYGSGMRRFSFSTLKLNVSGRSGWEYLTDFCGDYGTDFMKCGQSLSSIQTIDLDDKSRWQEGFNSLFVSGYDWAGNSTSLTLPFIVDTVPPLTPDQLVVEGETEFGWTSKQHPSLSWRNVGESYDIYANPPQIEARHRMVPAIADETPVSSFSSAQVVAKSRSEMPIEFPSRQNWSLELAVSDLAGNISGVVRKTIGFDDHQMSAPAIDDIQWYGPSRRTLAWQPPADHSQAASGLCDYAKLIDELSDSVPAESGSPDRKPSMQLPDDIGHGAHHLHVRAISCAGVPGEVAHKVFSFDSRPPAVTADKPAGSWINEHEALRISGVDNDSGVAEIRYRTGDGGRTISGGQASLSLDEGMRDLSIVAADAVGNESSELKLRVGFDRTAPVSWIEPRDPMRPTLIAAQAYDADSGIEEGTIQYRPSAGGEWTDLDTDPARGVDGAVSLKARFPDDKVAAGEYQLRVSVSDRAGHRSFSELRIDGTSASFSSPQRGSAMLRAGVIERVKRPCRGDRGRAGSCFTTQTRTAATVDFGRSAVVGGSLTGLDGQPMPGVKLKVLTVRERSSARIESGEVVTDSKGRFNARVGPGVNRTVIVQMPGSELLRPVEDSVIVATRSRLRLKADRKKAVAGRTIIFSGKVFLGNEKLGKLGVNVQIMLAGTKTAVWDEQTAQDGTFRMKYKIPDYTRRLRFHYQARVLHGGGWLYMTGRSKPVIVDISPRRR